MSEVISIRLDDLQRELLDECQLPGTTRSGTIIKALEYYYDNVVMPNRDCDLVVDFAANYDGVNNSKVDELLNILFNNGYELYMYMDGDRVGIHKKAD